MNDISIIAYRTHIEIKPYSEGFCPSLERFLSKYDYVCHKWIRVAYYIHNHTLYIPRGVSLKFLYKLFNVEPKISEIFDPMKKIDPAKPLLGPKNDIQKEAIDFLLSKEKFHINEKRSQLALNID